MHKNRVILSTLVLWLAIVSCNLPTSPATQPAANVPGADLTATAMAAAIQGGITVTAPMLTATSTIPAEATLTVTASVTPCTPGIVASTSVNVRSGPGTVYGAIGAIPQGGNAAVTGKNADGTWWVINFPAGAGGVGWVAASVVTASCIPSSLVVVAAPPTPQPPSGTCKDGYVFRLARSSDNICVPPASKTQSDADNAAADSRKIVNVYGSDACVEGYVWREAFTGDHVCVTTAVHSQAAADNAAAASRWVSGAYGPHTCIAGFVWREAGTGDDVCVTGDVRTQAATDNAAASSRIASADACISGYVWRNAFSGDHVCVTPAVQSQVAADNVAAPSHTWP
jgi:uncharacterized protein YraI